MIKLQSHYLEENNGLWEDPERKFSINTPILTTSSFIVV